jgi:predicted O-methyltransferase YrrM
MKKIKKILNLFKGFIDVFLLVFIIPSSISMYCFRKYSHKFTYTKKYLNLIGVFPILDHYYEPQFNFENYDKDITRNLPGVKLNPNDQLKNLNKLINIQEIKNLRLDRGSTNYNFKINNKFFNSSDAEIYYQMIRYFKPKQIIEIGSGYSSLIALEAVKKNKEIDNVFTKIKCIEPYENEWLENFELEIIREKVEQLDKKLFLSLKQNDFIFIDSSHIIKPSGDILKIYLEILPILSKGVIIHIHDIFTPKDYPEKWMINENKFWNEQYLVEILLRNNTEIEVFLMLNYLKNNFYNELKKKSFYLKNADEPSSIYLIKK